MDALKIYAGAGSLMKTKIPILCLFFLSGNATYAKNSDSVCMFQGKKLYGRIRIVANFPDIKVSLNRFETLRKNQMCNFLSGTKIDPFSFVRTIPITSRSLPFYRRWLKISFQKQIFGLIFIAIGESNDKKIIVSDFFNLLGDSGGDCVCR